MFRNILLRRIWLPAVFAAGQAVAQLPVYDGSASGRSGQADAPPVFPLAPNSLPKGIMTPAAWGAGGPFVFGMIGGTYPQSYRKEADLTAGFGAGIGDSRKTVSAVAILNINDVSAFRNFSGSLVISRQINASTFISAGALHLFASSESDGLPSYYIVVSHAVQGLPSSVPGYSRLQYSVGFGTGRFLRNSPADVQAGKKKNGTGLFAHVTYELFRKVNAYAEWTGLNLCAGVSVRPLPRLPALNLGLTDITRLSGDKPRAVFGIGFSLPLQKRKKSG